MASPKTIFITVPRRGGGSEVSRLGFIKSIPGTATTLLPNGVRIKQEGSVCMKPQTTFIQPNSMNLDVSLLSSSMKMSSDDDDDLDQGPPRKRKRLTHLTPEERLMRRKLKNRVAAQTARDRKKARMDELEIIVNNLEAENARLMDENKDLRVTTESLNIENAELRHRLDGHELDVVKTEVESCESAAGPNPTSVSIAIPVADHFDDDQSDAIFNILKEIGVAHESPELARCPVPKSALSENPEENPTARPPMVGTPAKELESIHELVKFDHVYFKSDHPRSDCLDLRVSKMNHIEPVLTLKDIENLEQILDSHLLQTNSKPSDTVQGSYDSAFSDSCLGSPCSDAGYSNSASPASASSLLGDGVWEESFSELFPNLV